MTKDEIRYNQNYNVHKMKLKQALDLSRIIDLLHMVEKEAEKENHAPYQALKKNSLKRLSYDYINRHSDAFKKD